MDSTDGRIYRYIKNELRFEKYLEISDSRLRHAISKVRLSSHLLYIERGRWSQPQIDRVNIVCDAARCCACLFFQCVWHFLN